MAKKKHEPEDKKTSSWKNRLITLEKTDRNAFIRELHLRGAKAEDWEKFKKLVGAEIARARFAATPSLSVKKMAAKVGTSESSIRAYEEAKKSPILFNLWMISIATGKKLKIVFE